MVIKIACVPMSGELVSVVLFWLCEGVNVRSLHSAVLAWKEKYGV